MRERPQAARVRLAESATPAAPAPRREAEVAFDQIVRPGDPDKLIYLTLDERDHALARAMRSLPCTLGDLGISVSTGRVVEFRATEWLRAEAAAGTVPLIYPMHFDGGRVRWPRAGGKKPNAIVRCAGSADLLVPSGNYVLVKRFSSKEERRRIVAVVFDPADVPCEVVGLENHVNYFHARGQPLEPALALGLTVFLNSTPVDAFFRQFNGHTQVNATDLRALRYPDAVTLRACGEGLGGWEQAMIDERARKVLGEL